MCRWCPLPELTPRYRRGRYLVSQALIVGALVYMTAGFLRAQSQDYINATVNANLHNLEARVSVLDKRVATIDDRMWYVLTGIAATLGVQLLNLRNTYKKDK